MVSGTFIAGEAADRSGCEASLYHSTSRPAPLRASQLNPSPAEIARLKALQLQAYEHLLRGRADLARPLVEEFRRAVPKQSKALKQLVIFLESVAFEWAAERSPYRPAARPAPAGGLDIVAFHADRPGEALSRIHEQAIDYMEVLARSFESARLRAPGARTVLLTDESTPVP